jgi:hypothetical protein
MMPVCVLVDIYPRAVRRARSPVAVGEIIVVILTDLIKKYAFITIQLDLGLIQRGKLHPIQSDL